MQVPANGFRRRGPVVEVAPAAALALDVDRDRRRSEQPLPSPQPGVEPVEGGVGHAALSSPAQMATSPDAKANRSRRPLQRGVVLQHARQRVVVPTVDEQRGHRPLSEEGPEAHRRPERILDAAVLELVAVQRQVHASELVNDLPKGQVVETGP